MPRGGWKARGAPGAGFLAPGAGRGQNRKSSDRCHRQVPAGDPPGEQPARVNKRSFAGWWGGGSRAGSRSQPAGGQAGRKQWWGLPALSFTFTPKTQGAGLPRSQKPVPSPVCPLWPLLEIESPTLLSRLGTGVHTATHAPGQPGAKGPATEGRRRPARPGVWAARLGGSGQRGLPVKEEGDNGIDGSLGAV